MKKFFAVMAVVLSLTMVLTACGGTATTPATGTDAEQNTDDTNDGDTIPEYVAPDVNTPEIPVADPAVMTSFTVGKQSVGWRQYTYNGQEVNRRFFYYIPSSYEAGEQLPVMFTLHGSTSNASWQLAAGKWTALAEKEGFILIAPESIAIHADGTLSSEGKSMNQIGQSDMSYLRWCATDYDPQNTYGVDDVQYLSDLIDQFVADGCADASRIYMCGLSHGAFMTMRMAMEAPEKLAGVGIVSGLLCNQFTTTAPSQVVRTVFIHGTADGVVPISGMSNFALSVSDSAKQLLTWAGVTAEATVTAMPDKSTTDGTTTTRYEYDKADGTAQVIEYIIEGGTHAWPGNNSMGITPGTSMDFQASEIIWNDLKTAVNPMA